jgi:hypothetical protein
VDLAFEANLSDVLRTDAFAVFVPELLPIGVVEAVGSIGD